MRTIAFKYNQIVVLMYAEDHINDRHMLRVIYQIQEALIIEFSVPLFHVESMAILV